MSKNTRIIATAIPNNSNLFNEKGCLFLSVSLSPQLAMRGSSIHLSRDYYEVYNWPLYAAFWAQKLCFKIEVYDGDWSYNPTFSFKLGRTQIVCRTNTGTHDSIGLELWQRMFPGTTPVSHWQQSAVPFRIKELMTRKTINDRAKEAVIRCVDLIQSDAGLRGNIDGGMLNTFTHVLLELSELDIELMLEHPLLGQDLGHPLLMPLLDELNGVWKEYREELQALMLRLELTEVYERNVTETGEFHKRFSAYTQHPKLLERTGWLWDFEILLNSDQQTKLETAGRAENCKKIFITVDDDVFDLSAVGQAGISGLKGSSAVLPGPDEVSDTTSPSPKSDSLRAAQPADTLNMVKNEARAGLIPAAGDEAFWLAYLNELDVSCPLTNVEVDPAKKTWKTGRLHQLDSAHAQKPGRSVFSPFDDYVEVDNEYFSVRSYLVDRKQLYQKIEDRIHSNDGQPGVGADAIPKIAAGGTAAAGSAPDEKNSYNTSGITLVIDRLAAIMNTAVSNDPLAQRQAITKSRIENRTAPADRQDIANALESSALIYQHHVHHGYRVDVIAVNPADAAYVHRGSLCNKREIYHTRSGKYAPLPYQAKDDDVLPVDDLEGWVSESAQTGSDAADIFVDQELFRWNDWNLVVPLSGVADEQRNDCLQIETLVPEASQVPLRYLWKYSFAIRPTDICGKSLPAINDRINRYDRNWMDEQFRRFLEGVALQPVSGDDKFDIHRYFTPPIEYLRVDGLHAPRLFCYKHNLRQWDHEIDVSVASETPGEVGDAPRGEHLTTLIVRSFCANDGYPEREPDADDIRLIAPPRTSLNMVIQHGVLDKWLNPNGGAYNAGDIMDELLGLDYIDGDEREAAKVDIARIDDRDTINYLYDPLVDGFEILVNGNPYRIPLGYAAWDETNKTFNRYWAGRSYHKITLEGERGYVADPEALRLKLSEHDGRKETTFLLKQGYSAEVGLGCTAADSFMGADPYYIFLPGIQKAHHSKLTVIHAVQRPCLLHGLYDTVNPKQASLLAPPPSAGQPWVRSNFDHKDAGTFLKDVYCNELTLLPRTPKANALNLHIKFPKFPVLTADAYILHIQYTDVICDRRTSRGFRVAYVERIIKSGILPDDEASETNVVFSRLLHELPDTKYRCINYQIEAVSKFRQYFNASGQAYANSIKGLTHWSFDSVRKKWDDLLLMQPGTPRDEKTLQNLQADYETAATRLLPVLSTAKPKEPRIEKIVPLLRWVKTGSTIKRQCSALRIYLEGDWHSSGWGEQLAILYRREDEVDTNDTDDKAWVGRLSSRNSVHFSPPSDTEYKEQNLSQLISQFGKDPIADSTGMGDSSTIGAAFFTKTESDAVKVRVRQLEYEKPVYSDANVDLSSALGGKFLRFVTAKVMFMSAKELNRKAGLSDKPLHRGYATEGKFYADICLDEKELQKHYFPFLRLAVACYQPNSIQPESDDCRYDLSKVVMTDFVQPLPYRTLTIQDNGNSSVTINWDGDENVQSQRAAQYKNEIFCLFDMEANDECLIYNIDRNTLGMASSADNAMFHKLEPGKCKSVFWPPGATAITIVEYECYQNDQLTEPVPANASPRDEIRRRMIFSYTHQRYGKPVTTSKL